MKGIFTLLSIGLLFYAVGVRMVSARDLEAYAAKAAFVFNFTKFIQWPVQAACDGKPVFHLFVFGNEEVKNQFITIDGKDSSGGIIQVHYSDPDSFEIDKAFAKCDLVFISRHISASDTQRILQQIDGKPILSIGEDRNFTRMGGIIKFFTKDDRLYFEVNTTAASAHNLKFSSKLLRLAVIVD